jgi:hydroxyacylglutathione hydrolase
MLIRQIMDDKLAQYAFLVGCQQTGEAIVIDPERDIDRYLDLAAREGLRIVAVAETHIHADFLSGARELAARVPGLRVHLSDAGDAPWKYEWPAKDGVTVTWLYEGTTFTIGKIEFRTWHTPGHTPEHVSFLVVDRGAGASEPMGVLTGDFVFVGDVGRPDLLESAAGVQGAREPAARRLYTSTRRFVDLPDFLQVWPAHGAGSACGKALGAVPASTVGYERRVSPAIAASDRGEQAFVDYILSGQPEPPLYFAAMKRLNKIGPDILDRLPSPPRLTVQQAAELVRDRSIQVVDTRDRHAFFHGHVPGAYHAPINKAFPTVIGSFLDPDRKIVLFLDEPRVDDAVRALVRIGYDQVAGWAPVETIEELRASGTALEAMESIDFAELARRRSRGPLTVLDVRGASEYQQGHLSGAVNIAHTRLRARLAEVPRNQPVYVHCLSGGRAAAASAFLAHEGFAVVDVDGSFTAWQAEAASSVAATPMSTGPNRGQTPLTQ